MTRFTMERLLARTFFRRFFETDLMPPGFAPTQMLIWSIALFAGPGYLMSFAAAIRYETIPHARLPDTILLDELRFVTFAMIALGAVALIVWEGVFPDRRDVRILGVLPLSIRAHVTARVAALAALAAIFSVSMNLPPAIVYGLTLWGHDAAAGPLRGIGAHLISTSLAGLFTFFLLIAAQGLVIAVLGRRTAQRFALLLQALFVVVLLQALLFVPHLGSAVLAAFAGDHRLPAAYMPPAWFLALYNVLAGTARPVPVTYAVTAAGVTVGAIVMATGLLAASYRRLVRMALETPDGGGRGRAGLPGIVSRAIARMAARDPVARAVTGFTVRTVFRSRTHLTLLATYAGVAAALVLPALLQFVGPGAAAVDPPGVALLSVALVCNFILLGGMRVLFAIPTEIKANWAFRLYAPDDRMVAVIAGVRTALLLAVVLPIAVAAGVGGIGLWGARTGALHASFTAVLGVLLVDVLLIGLRKIPFTCTYYPGRSRARTLWPIYGLAFSAYAYSMAGLEAALLGHPFLLATMYIAVLVIVAVLALLRRRDLQPPLGLDYEDRDPDAVFQGFGLSEGLAAESLAGSAPRHMRTK